MAFLVIAGQTVEVVTTGATRRAPRRAGAVVATFDNSLRSYVRSEKAEWSFTTGPMTATAMGTLRAACAFGAPVTCSGDALGGSITAVVEVGDESYLPDDTQASGFKLSAALSVRTA